MKRFVRDIAWTAFANYFVLLAGIPLAFVNAHFLSPELYAIIALVDVAMEMLKQYPLGTHFALVRDIPMHLARGDREAADRVRDSVWWLSVVAGIPVALVPAALARWVFHQPPTVQVCYLLGCTGTVVWTLGSVYQSVLKAEKRFKADAVSQMAVGLAPLVLVPLCVWRWNVAGYFLSNLLVATIALLAYVRMFDRHPKLRVSGSALREVLALGVPALLVGLVDSGYAAVPRIRLEPMVPAAALGLFYFAWKMNRYFVTFPQSIGRVFFPNLATKLATAKSERDISQHVVVPTYFVGQAMALLMGGAALFLPEVFRNPASLTFLPDSVIRGLSRYAGSATAMQILILAAWWSGVGMIPWKHLQAVKSWLPALSGHVLAVAAVWFGMGAIRGSITVDRAAVITGLAMVVCNLTFMVLSFRRVAGSAGEAFAFLVRACVPFVLMMALVWGILDGWQRFIAPAWAPGPLLAAACRAAILGLAWIPIGVLFWRRHGGWLRAVPASAKTAKAGGEGGGSAAPGDGDILPGA